MERLPRPGPKADTGETREYLESVVPWFPSRPSAMTPFLSGTPLAGAFAQSRRAVVILGTLILTACMAGDRVPSSDTLSAASIADTGTGLEGEEQIAWSSEVVEGNITEITEQLSFGTDGRAERILRFTPDGVLTEYREVRTQSASGSSDAASSTPSRVELTVQMAGDSVISHSRMVDGVATDLPPDDLAFIRRHAAATLQRLRLPDSSDAARRD